MSHRFFLSLLLLLAALSTAVLADTPAKIAEDYQKAAASAVAKLNETLEKATTPLIAALIKAGDTAGAEQLTAQLKAKTAGEPVPTPQASATLLFAQYDQARGKALEPAQKAAVSRIDAMLSGKEGKDLATVTELGKVRAEIEAGNPAAAASSSPAMAAAAATAPNPTSTGAGKSLAEVVKALGGTCTSSTDGDEVSFTSTNLTTADLLQIGTFKRLKSFTWNGGRGLTDEGLAAFAGMKKLTGLFLWSTGRITDEGLKHLATCEKLESLNIGADGDGVTGAGFESLSKCKSLKTLTLNLLPNIEGRHLRFLVGLKSFENLRLSGCTHVTDADMEWIGQMTSLKYLHVGRTGVTNAGMGKLAGLRHLEELTVTSPMVTPEGGAPLKKARPALEVIFTK